MNNSQIKEITTEIAIQLGRLLAEAKGKRKTIDKINDMMIILNRIEDDLEEGK